VAEAGVATGCSTGRGEFRHAAHRGIEAAGIEQQIDFEPMMEITDQ